MQSSDYGAAEVCDFTAVQALLQRLPGVAANALRSVHRCIYMYIVRTHCLAKSILPSKCDPTANPLAKATHRLRKLKYSSLRLKSDLLYSGVVTA